MSERPVCARCAKLALNIEAYRMAASLVMLCLGCVADARLAGIEVHWIPRRLVHAGELAALNAAFETQARIIKAQRG